MNFTAFASITKLIKSFNVCGSGGGVKLPYITSFVLSVL